MSRIVRIHGDAAVYPAGACVSCLRPATCEIEISKVKGQVVRRVRVPFCRECAALRRFKSSRQLLFERVAAVGSVLLGLAAGVYAYARISFVMRSPSGYGSVDVWALLLGALSAHVVFGVAYLAIEPLSRRFRSSCV